MNISKVMKQTEKEIRKIYHENVSELDDFGLEEIISCVTQALREQRREVLEDMWHRTITLYDARKDRDCNHYNQIHKLNQYIAVELKQLEGEK